MTHPRRTRRTLLAAALVGTLLAAAFVVAGMQLFVYPAVDEPQKTDVIFVIGPPTDSRVKLAEQLIAEGYSSNLMISAPDSGEFAAPTLAVCHEQHAFAVYCAMPHPFTTQGEARYLRDLSQQHGWTSATIITATPHVTRARIIMQRCFTGTVLMVPDTTELLLRRWVYEFFYQSSAFVKVAVDQQC